VNQGPAAPIQALLKEALGLHQAGQLAQAERIYRQILAVDPRHADCLHLLGMIDYQAGRLDGAADLIRQAIAIHGAGASYYANLGTVVQAQGKLDEAKALYRKALSLKPNLAEVHVNLGNVLQLQNEYDESVACYRRALALQPECAETYNNLGNALQSQGQLEDAVACYERALAIRPNYAEVYYNLGNARRAEDRLEEAVAYYRQALALKPDYPEVYYNFGNVLREQGKLDETLERFAIALTLRPEYTQAAFGQALAQLLQGNFADGWRNFEVRWQSMEDHDTPRRVYAQPAWTGEKLASGSVLLWGEQGVGDEIMFAGLIPDALRSGNSLVLDCEPRLNRLFARSFPAVEVVSGCGPGQHPELEIAAQLPTGSLPGLFRRSSAEFPANPPPYLVADPAMRERLRARYADGRRIVGLAWQTNSRKTGRFRSIFLSQFAPLFARPGIRWVSLQYGDHADLEDEATEAGAPLLVDRTVDQLKDIDVFAAQVAALDLVITIDNSTAHLAGALGVPVWVLLPFAPDWRWQLEREDSPWYPAMRLFRQPQPGDWQSAMEQVESAL
jgi:tetratricopeptide (TPR) repeat protein